MELTRGDVSGSKRDVRKHILMLRDRMAPEEKAGYDARIRQCILSLPAYREAQVILAYASYRSEVDTMMLIEAALSDGKRVFAPKVSGNEMEFWQIMSLADLQAGYRGIPEPVQNNSFSEWIMHDHGYTDPKETAESKKYKIMMWMPGAVFDKKRHRIGYGKGFYDRYLGRILDENKRMTVYYAELQMTTAALAYSCQILPLIPCEEHDIRPDMLITEKGIL